MTASYKLSAGTHLSEHQSLISTSQRQTLVFWINERPCQLVNDPTCYLTANVTYRKVFWLFGVNSSLGSNANYLHIFARFWLVLQDSEDHFELHSDSYGWHHADSLQSAVGTQAVTWLTDCTGAQTGWQASCGGGEPLWWEVLGWPGEESGLVSVNFFWLVSGPCQRKFENCCCNERQQHLDEMLSRAEPEAQKSSSSFHAPLLLYISALFCSVSVIISVCILPL